MVSNIEFKLVVLGAQGVGKSSLLNSYIKGTFSQQSTTIGAAFARKQIIVDGTVINLSIWDTAGQERFKRSALRCQTVHHDLIILVDSFSMTPMYYRNANAAILVFDVTQPNSVQQVRAWKDELMQFAPEDILYFCAANKCDLRGTERAPEGTYLSSAEIQQVGADLSCAIFETSAKTFEGLDSLFNALAAELLHRYRATAAANPVSLSASSISANSSSDTLRLDDEDEDEESSKGCC